jgi:hypothetical protein
MSPYATLVEIRSTSAHGDWMKQTRFNRAEIAHCSEALT